MPAPTASVPEIAFRADKIDAAETKQRQHGEELARACAVIRADRAALYAALPPGATALLKSVDVLLDSVDAYFLEARRLDNERALHRLLSRPV